MGPFSSWDQLRRIRNDQLRDSDWTQMPDAPLTAGQVSSWATHRQTLRNIPQDHATLEAAAANWPVAPA